MGRMVMDLKPIFSFGSSKEFSYQEEMKNITMNPKVDAYLVDGCGRCNLFRTPQCKVNFWREEMALLRQIVLECGLTEELKWSVPVYTFEDKNVLIVSAFNENCVLSFLKGALLKDEKKILEKPGENTQSGRVVRFTDLQKVFELETVLRDYIREAIEIEKSGEKVKFKEISEHEIPAELEAKFAENPEFNAAFDRLTPGRKRSYYIHISQAKQSKTRIERVEKCTPKIFSGKGFFDR
jgi:uncharacterized protein YdeI (YjbR/CyaY-like superfamily)